MDPIVLSMLLQAGLGAISGGFGAGQQASQENARRRAAEGQRARLLGLIDQIRDVGYADVDMAQSAAYTDALNQATAGAASRGVSGGVRNAAQDRVLAGAIADLARFKEQDQRAREQQIAGILQNDAFGVPEGQMDVVGQGLLGGLIGLAGGGAEGLGNVLGNTELSAELFGSDGGGGGGGGATAGASPGDAAGAFSRDPLGFLTGGGATSRSSGSQLRSSGPTGGGGGGSPMQFTPGAGLTGGVLGDMLVRSANTSTQRG